jgi:rubrerythrin
MRLLHEKLLLEEDGFEDIESTDEETVEEPAEEESSDEFMSVDDLPTDDTDVDSMGDEGTEIPETPATTLYKVEFTLGSHSNWSRIEATSEEEAKQIVQDYITKKWPDRDYEFVSVEEFSEEDMEESLNESLNENAYGMGEYSDKFHNYFLFLLNERKEEELPYLVSQLIRYCKEEDLKDLWIDRMGKVAEENGFGTTNESLKEGLEDESVMAQRYVDYEIPALCKKVLDFISNMSESALISLNRHCLRWHSSVEDVLDMSGYYSKDSMTESLTDAQPIEAGAAVGMASVISDLIKDEYEAIDGYNSAIATAEAEGFEEMINVLTEIQAEENIHIGQLQTLMNTVDPNAHLVDDGRQEGAEQLANPLGGAVTESLNEDVTIGRPDYNVDMTDEEYEEFRELLTKHYGSPEQFFKRLHAYKPDFEIHRVEYDEIPEDTITLSSSDISQGTGNVIVYTVMGVDTGKIYMYADF